MKLKIILTLLLSSSIFLTSCAPVNIDDENEQELHNTIVGKDTLIEIGDYLYYDSTTRIVYWWNGCLYNYDSSTTPSPYYAPNGLPYKYNPETNTFEEIDLSESLKSELEKELIWME